MDYSAPLGLPTSKRTFRSLWVPNSIFDISIHQSLLSKSVLFIDHLKVQICWWLLDQHQPGAAVGYHSANRNAANRPANARKSAKETFKPEAKRKLNPADSIPKRVEIQTWEASLSFKWTASCLRVHALYIGNV